MLNLLLRTLILYAIVTAAVRFMGKRQVGELQSAELVITMLVSELASIPLTEPGVPLLVGIVPILTLVVCEIIISVLMMKCHWFRRLICGRPITVIQKGTPKQEQMRQLRYTVEDLAEALRLQGVFNLNDVDTAIIETNGQLSVLKNATSEPPSAQMMGISAETDFWTVVVDDGSFCKRSAQIIGCDREWLETILKKEQCKLCDVFLFTANSNLQYRLIRKNNNKQ